MSVVRWRANPNLLASGYGALFAAAGVLCLNTAGTCV